MKKIIFIAIIAISFFSSCQVTDEKEIRDISTRGLFIYGITTDYSISKYLLGLDNVLKVEEILNAPYEKRDSLEDVYFPSAKIRNDKDSIYIKGFASVGKTNDTPISQEGAARSYHMKNFVMNITCTGEGKYRLESYAPPLAEPATVLDAVVIRKKETSDNSIYTYSLYGSGFYFEAVDTWGYAWENYVITDKDSSYQISYTIDESSPLLAFLTPSVSSAPFGTFRFFSGKMEMNVSGTGVKNDTDIVKAAIRYSSENSNSIVLSLQYRGETSSWNI